MCSGFAKLVIFQRCPLLWAHYYRQSDELWPNSSASVDVLCWTLKNTVARQPLLLSSAVRSQIPDEPWPADQPLLVFSVGCSQIPDEPWPADQPLLVFSAVRSQVPDEPWPADQPLLVFSAERSQVPDEPWPADHPLLVFSAGHSQVPDEPWPADQSLLVFFAVSSQTPLLVSLCWCPLLCTLTNYLMRLGQLISLCWCSLLYAHNCRLMLLSLLLDRSCTNSEKKNSTFIAKNAIWIKMCTVMKKLCLIFYWNEEESLEYGCSRNCTVCK